MLRVSSRSGATTTLIDVATPIQSRAERAGGGPTRYTPPRIRGTYTRPQIAPLTRTVLRPPQRTTPPDRPRRTAVATPRELVPPPADLFAGGGAGAVEGHDGAGQREV